MRKWDFVIRFEGDGLKTYLSKCKDNGDYPEEYLGGVFSSFPLFCEKVRVKPEEGVIQVMGCTLEEGYRKDIVNEAVRGWMQKAVGDRFKRSDNVGVPKYEVYQACCSKSDPEMYEDQACQDAPCGAAPLGCGNRQYCPKHEPEDPGSYDDYP
jgi:hypothetical protein